MKKIIRAWWKHFLRWVRDPRILWRADTPIMQTTIEVRHWLPFVAFLVSFIWYIAAPSGVALMSVIMLGGILLSSFLWARTMARGAKGDRTLRFAAMQVGDELEEEISLRNRTSLPLLWAEFFDRSSIPGYTVSSARAASPNSRMTWRAHTICTRRGVFSLGPWEMRIGEPFGILLVRQLYLQKQEILVYPPLAALPEQVLPHRGALGDHRQLNQPLFAETISTYSVRGYTPGDPLRHIHWRTSARRGDTFVKVFAPEAASNVWLVPDFDSSVHAGEGDDSSQETMVTVVASLAAEMLQQHLSVGLFASAEKDSIILPRQGQPHLWTILQAIAPLHTVPDRHMEEILNRAASLISGNDLLILVTPSLRPDWIAPLRRISRSRGSGGRAEVVLLDPASFHKSTDDSNSHAAAESFLTFLLEQGLIANLLRREDVRLISGYYGEVQRWEFAVLGTGRAVLRKAPRAATPEAHVRIESAGQSTERMGSTE